MTGTERDSLRLSLSAGIAAVAVSLVLVGLKGWGLLATGSLTIAASLADSALDLMVSIGAIATILYAARPADEDHAFGHSAVEDLFALAQAALVAVSAGLIGWRAVLRIGEPVALRAEETGLAVMLAASVATLGLVLWQRRVIRRTGSQVVAADQLHYLGDLVPNAAAMAALAASAAWGVSWPDTALSLAAAAVLLVAALRLGGRAVDGLMDREADAETVAAIRTIAAGQRGLEGFHDLRTRRSGSRLFVQIHVEIDGRRSLDVIVHKDPAGQPAEIPHTDPAARS